MVRALGAALTHPPAVGAVTRVPWATFGLALAATQAAPDELVVVLSHYEHQTSTVFSVDDLSLIRWAAHFVGRAHFHRLAVDSLEHDLVPQLLRTMRTLHLVRAVITRPFPMQLDELEHTANAVAAATTRPRPVDRPAHQPRPQAAAPPIAAPWTRALHPPRRNDVRPPAPTFTYAPEITALDGVAIGSLMLRVPSRPAQLRQWGHVLRNCLGDFVGSVSTGESIIIGVCDRDAMVGALELSRARSLRQFVGQRNRVLRPEVTDAVIRYLYAWGVLTDTPA